MFLRLDLNVQKSTFSQSLSEFENPGRPHIRFLGSGSRITLETMAYELFKTYTDYLEWDPGEAEERKLLGRDISKMIR